MPYNMAHEKHHLSKQDYQHARACVNACAGMDDPAKELFKLRTELQAMQHTIDLLQKKNAELKTELANVRKERNALYIRLKSKRP